MPNVNAPKNWNSQDGLVMLPTTEEKKRSELIDELMRIDEPLIAWAVITASPCYFTSGHLSLEYRDPAYSAWAKILMDLKQKPRLLAVARQNYPRMSTNITPKAIVENCILLPAPDEVTPGIKITVYRVEARMLVPANKFSDDIYMVRITKPEGMGDLMDDEGALMEHGRFPFDSTQEVPKDTELELEITEIAP